MCEIKLEHHEPYFSKNYGVGVTYKTNSSVIFFSHFLSNHLLSMDHCVHIWQVSPQLCCGDTCQIWIWFWGFERYLAKSIIALMEELLKGSFQSPTLDSYLWNFDKIISVKCVWNYSLPNGSHINWQAFCPSLYGYKHDDIFFLDSK